MAPQHLLDVSDSVHFVEFRICKAQFEGFFERRQ
jgi:hypothetical protein